MKGIIALFKFGTRLSVNESDKMTSEDIGKGMKYFPIIGIAIGLVMYAIYFLLSYEMQSQLLVAAFVIFIYILITSGTHLVGMADIFDSIFSYRSKQKMLEALKDKKFGANGAVAICLYIIFSILLFSEIEMRGFPLGAVILLYPVIGRMAAVLNCAASESAKSSGPAKYFVEYTRLGSFIFSFLITVIYSYIVLNYFMLPQMLLGVILIVSILSFYFAKIMKRKIDGITEDTLGAVIELTQIATLFIFALII
ncbi:MAG: adenosylcobinamide-GDP ribazoletransferase [Fusobacteriaceae bacterium]